MVVYIEYYIYTYRERDSESTLPFYCQKELKHYASQVTLENMVSLHNMYTPRVRCSLCAVCVVCVAYLRQRESGDTDATFCA